MRSCRAAQRAAGRPVPVAHMAAVYAWGLLALPQVVRTVGEREKREREDAQACRGVVRDIVCI